jgi:hypothetical protein
VLSASTKRLTKVPLVARDKGQKWFIWLLSAPSLPSCALGYVRAAGTGESLGNLGHRRLKSPQPKAIRQR